MKRVTLKGRRMGVPLLLALSLSGAALAQSTEPKTPAQMARERCITRLTMALSGKSPSTALLASANPQGEVPPLLATPDFIEQFSRFINSQFNMAPGDTAKIDEDTSYYLAKHVLTQKLPWNQMFVGQFRVERTADNSAANVVQDPAGLGYFRSKAWLQRYAGSEGEGYKLVTAYRIMNNVTGLVLVPAAANEIEDPTTVGRQATSCRGCHFDSPFALDKAARVLTRRKGEGDKMTFEPSTEAPQQFLDGKTIHDDKELVETLVSAKEFPFNTCRLAFRFLYARDEFESEDAVFKRCLDSFAQNGTIQSALTVLAQDPAYCR